MRFKFEEPLPADGFGVITVRCAVREFTFPCIFVVADGYEDFNFGVHKSPNFYDEWAVSDISTGMAIGQGTSMEEAMTLAAARLATKQPEQVRAQIDKQLAKLREAGRIPAPVAG